jgi:dolichol-phosphate mannosyltransferase
MHPPSSTPVELSLVIPTLNESGNIVPLLERLDRALAGIAWEVLFVDDDSKDGTPALIRKIGRQRPNVRVLHRIGRRGLSSACIEGIMASVAPYVAVMDADMQHDETVLPEMLAKVRDERYDIAVGSRNVGSGSMGSFSESRVFLSNAGKRLSQLVCKIEIQDPMSGFFLFEREFAQSAIRHMSGYSFKILVDMISASPQPPKWIEVPYTFRGRVFGESKLDPNTLLEFGILLIHKAIRGLLPVRFVLFSLVGASGATLHLAVLAALYGKGVMNFSDGQAIATGCAMISNFWLNNQFTFRERRLKGVRMLRGAVTFFAACAVGALSSIALAEWVFVHGGPWYVAGFAGTMIAAVWNFGVTSVLTWPERTRG